MHLLGGEAALGVPCSCRVLGTLTFLPPIAVGITVG